MIKTQEVQDTTVISGNAELKPGSEKGKREYWNIRNKPAFDVHTSTQLLLISMRLFHISKMGNSVKKLLLFRSVF